MNMILCSWLFGLFYVFLHHWKNYIMWKHHISCASLYSVRNGIAILFPIFFIELPWWDSGRIPIRSELRESEIESREPPFTTAYTKFVKLELSRFISLCIVKCMMIEISFLPESRPKHWFLRNLQITRNIYFWWKSQTQLTRSGLINMWSKLYPSSI